MRPTFALIGRNCREVPVPGDFRMDGPSEAAERADFVLTKHKGCSAFRELGQGLSKAQQFPGATWMSLAEVNGMQEVICASFRRWWFGRGDVPRSFYHLRLRQAGLPGTTCRVESGGGIGFTSFAAPASTNFINGGLRK